MLLDVVDAFLQVAEALRRVHVGQVAQKVHQPRAEVPRETQPATDDLLVRLYRAVAEKRRITCGHLVDEDPEGPPVGSLAVPDA